MVLKITMPKISEKKEVEIGDYFYNQNTQSICRIIRQRDNSVYLVDIINAEIIMHFGSLSIFKSTFVNVASNVWIHYKEEDFELIKIK